MAAEDIATLARRSAGFDPYLDDARTLITMCFGKSPAKTYAVATAVAMAATAYRKIDVMGAELHIAMFGKSAEQASRAIALLGYIADWKGAQFFARGRALSDSWAVRGMLSCYVQACACDDSRAYCNYIDQAPAPGASERGGVTRISVDLFGPEAPRALFPCRLLQGVARLDPDHPATMRDQIQAAAVARAIDWCPLFDADAFRRIS